MPIPTFPPADLSKALATRFARLKQKKYRQAEQLYLAEGLRTVMQLCHRLQAGKTPADLPEAIIFSAETLEQAESSPESEAAIALSRVKETAKVHPLKLYTAGAKVMGKLSDTQQPQGVLAVMHMPGEAETQAWLRRVRVPEKGSRPHLLLALDSVADPGNLGTLYRSAAWFAAAGLLLGSGCVDAYNPKVVRSTAGASGSLPLAQVSLPDVLNELEQAGFRILLLDLNPQARPLYDAIRELMPSPTEKPDMTGVVFVVGNEAHGISEELRGRFQAVFIPGAADAVESLNAGVSGSIAMSSFYGAAHQSNARF